MKKYRIYTGWLKADIEEREITRETEKCIFYEDLYFGKKRDNRENKVSESHEWFDTWDEAHSRLLELAQREVDGTRRRLDVANSTLGNIRGMKRPQPSQSTEKQNEQ